VNHLSEYKAEKTWHGKVTIMEIYHLTMTIRVKKWTIVKTAKTFGVSIGLVSENLRLAKLIHTDEKLLKCKTRTEALKKLK
jgi:hypothetical protein